MEQIIVDYIKLFLMNMFVYYCYEKNVKVLGDRKHNYIILTIINLFLIAAYIFIKRLTNLFLAYAILSAVYSVILAKLTNTKVGYSLVVTILSYGIALIAQGIAIIIQFFPYKLIYLLTKLETRFLSLFLIVTIQFLLLYGFFSIRRFKNGFSFLKSNLNTDLSDIIVINIGIAIILAYCLLGTLFDDTNQIIANTLIMFAILGVIMFFTIRKMITMYYKQKLLTDTMDANEVELMEKQEEIERLKAEKENISKIVHEFDKRQKALELLVTSNMNMDNIDKTNVSPKVLEMIQTLSKEYSESYEKIKKLPKLDECGILEIDNMFKYMQSECIKDNIEFKLKIMGNIHSLVNNIIPKNKLETLIGDHVKDAINAVNLTSDKAKEILVMLGMKNKKYELCIFDTGVEFNIDTLLKLGLERVTTGSDRGGSGIGFMTTFETMNETKASLVITEYPKESNSHYTKSVTIRFEGKNQYRIYSYRADEIKAVDTNNRIKVEEYVNNK